MRLAAALLLWPGLASAQPRLVPQGDVDAIYHLSGAAAEQIPGGAPGGVRLRWDAQGQRLRAEPVGGAAYAITDLQRRVADIVFPGQSAVLELPLRDGDPQALLAGSDARFTRRGVSHVLGMECTDWTIKARHVDGVGCVTADGIVLRAEGSFDGRPGSAVATAVTRGPVDPAAFRTPDQFFRLPLMGGR